MFDLSVVIVNYNTRDLLRHCLRSLQRSQDIALEVIVVDNASSDGSIDMLRAEFPEVIALPQSHNAWYCGGNNIGISRARADFVLLLNPDTEVAPDALALMLTFLRANPRYAAVTAQMRYPNGPVQRTGSEVANWLNLLLDYSLLGYLLPTLRRRLHDAQFYAAWDRSSDREVRVVPGSCMLMRRADIRLDDELLLYFPEDLLASQLHRPSYFLAAAQVLHHEKSSTRSFSATRIFFRDLLVFCRKRFGRPRMLLLWLLSRPVYWLMWLKNR